MASEDQGLLTEAEPAGISRGHAWPKRGTHFQVGSRRLKQSGCEDVERRLDRGGWVTVTGEDIEHARRGGAEEPLQMAFHASLPWPVGRDSQHLTRMDGRDRPSPRG